MIPMIKLQNFKERYLFNLAIDTLCSFCKDRAHCAGCAVTEIRRSTGQLTEKGIAHMDCCCMQPPEHDPELLRRHHEAIERIGGTLALLDLPEGDKNKLKAETDLYEKVILLEEIAARCVKR